MIPADNIELAYQSLKDVILKTPLEKNENLSQAFSSNIFLKREDLQLVRSYKIRGAYNKISSLSKSEKIKGVICASAGNHAQGVAWSCKKLQIKSKIFMPVITPKQKVNQVIMFGGEWVEVILHGDTFDEAYKRAWAESKLTKSAFIHPFDDFKIIEGQGTMGVEIMNELKSPIDYLFVPVGGGGLASGLSSYFKQMSPNTKIIGVEPAGAPSMKKSMEAKRVIDLKSIDNFVDGAAVKKVGKKTFEICSHLLDDIITVPEGEVCSTILNLYNKEAIVVEPAGALTISALPFYASQIKNKNVVCIVSGGNNDITRTEEIKERALLYKGLKHYFIIRFPQRAGALRDFLNHVLGPDDDITLFEYTKKNARENGPALIGIELSKKEDFDSLIAKMKEKSIIYEYLNHSPDLFRFII